MTEDGGVKFNEEVAQMIADGRLVPFSVLLYRPEDDAIIMYRLLAITDEEAHAMLRKFSWPRVDTPH